MSDPEVKEQQTSEDVKIEPGLEERPHNIFDVDDSSNLSTISQQRVSFLKQGDHMLEMMFKTTIDLDYMHTYTRDAAKRIDILTTDEELELLLFAVQCIDLTSLNGDDTQPTVARVCWRAVNALNREKLPQYKDLTCAAVCVYPPRVEDCKLTFKKLKVPEGKIKVATVAGGFPSGQYGIRSRLMEVEDAIDFGADEVDVVIYRPAVMSSNWNLLHDEISLMHKICETRKETRTPMKVILSAGELTTGSSASPLYISSLMAMCAGCDFVKTSTGKEKVNATLPIGYIMMRAIYDYHRWTGIKIGFKPAGGIKTYKQALEWLVLVKLMLGKDWLTKDLFRFGASDLLDSLEQRIIKLVETKEREEQMKEDEREQAETS